MKRFHKSRRKRPNQKEAEEWIKRGSGSVMISPDHVSITERKQRLAKLSEDLQQKLKSHLPRSRNLEIVILKCHILIEYMFDQFIDLIAPTEGVIENERFTFKQKESIVHMLGFPADPVFFPSIDLLNTIRNQVAHTLSVDRALIDKLIRINSEDPDDVRGLSDQQRASAIKQITKFLCGQMLGVIEAEHEMEWMDDLIEQAAHPTSEMLHK